MTWTHISDACIAACENMGIRYQQFQPDDQFHPVDAIDGKPGNKAGRIKLFADGQGGIVFNFKTGQQQPFFINSKQGERASTEELERIRREQQRRDREKLKAYDLAAHRAVEYLRPTQPASPDHPYLVRKRIKPHRARAGTWRRTIKNQLGERVEIAIENSLIIPMFNKDGKIRSLQAIFPETHPALNRDKDFLPGSQLFGLFFWFGPMTDEILIPEGFATAASLYEETGNRVYMAFTANNLMTVCRYIRGKLPDNEIIVCADNDANTSGNPGLTKATEAAEAIGARVAVPPITGDFNDFITSLGAVNDGS